MGVIARCLSKGKAGKDGIVDEATWQRMLILLQQMNSSLPPQVPSHKAGNVVLQKVRIALHDQLLRSALTTFTNSQIQAHADASVTGPSQADRQA